MNTKIFILSAFIGLGCLTACSTHDIKEEMAEQLQKPETIKEKQNLKAELASITLDETIMKKYLATLEAIDKESENQSDEEKRDKDWLEKVVVANGFDDMKHYEKVEKKINLLAIHLAAQDQKIKAELSKAKDEITKEFKENSAKEDDSWLEDTAKDVIADNIAKAAEKIVQHSMNQINELVQDVPAGEKDLVKKNLDKLRNPKHQVSIKPFPPPPPPM